MLCCDWLVFNSCDWRISMYAVSVNRSLGGPLWYGFPVVVSVSVDVVRVKSY